MRYCSLRHKIALFMMATASFAAGRSAIAAVTVYDFSTNAGVDRFAYGDVIPAASIPPAANSIPAIALTSYATISASDDSRYSTGVIEGGDVAAMRFAFAIAEPPATLTRIDILFEGGANENGIQRVYLWNAAAGSYTHVGSQSAVAPPDGTVTGTLVTNLSNYIGAGGELVLLVVHTAQGAALLADYISVTITGPQCATDPDCDDGLACNGTETCVGALLCQSGTPIVCNDGIACTVDTCVGPSGNCQYMPSDAACDNGIYCDGIEV